MTSSSSTVAPEVVTLSGGLTVSLASLQVLWSLEDRQFDIRVNGDALLIRPRARITPDDDRAIRDHRLELVALVRYCTDGVM
jgi:hypothetical protein